MAENKEEEYTSGSEDESGEEGFEPKTETNETEFDLQKNIQPLVTKVQKVVNLFRHSPNMSKKSSAKIFH